MAQTLAVAKYLNDLYGRDNSCDMDQMKMHKLMYFAFRDSLMRSDDPLFDDAFEAWKYGPVLRRVREEYRSGNMFRGDYGDLKDSEKSLVEATYKRYSKYSAWDLSALSHEELSWQQARRGVNDGESCCEELSLSAIKVDATREYLRRKGVVFS